MRGCKKRRNGLSEEAAGCRGCTRDASEARSGPDGGTLVGGPRPGCKHTCIFVLDNLLCPSLKRTFLSFFLSLFLCAIELKSSRWKMVSSEAMIQMLSELRWNFFGRMRWTFRRCPFKNIFSTSTMSSRSALYRNSNKGRSGKTQVGECLCSLSYSFWQINVHNTPRRPLLYFIC